jgi:hypothetical protein
VCEFEFDLDLGDDRLVNLVGGAIMLFAEDGIEVIPRLAAR